MNRLYAAAPHRTRTILCPVGMRHDRVSQATLVAYSLAKQYKARLVLLHVSAADAEVNHEGLTIASEQLRDLASRLSGACAIAITAVGDPASAIIRETAECDLLVMRPSRAWWLVGRLVDSLSQRVCRLAHCPVMLVEPGNCSSQQRHFELDFASAMAAQQPRGRLRAISPV